jgi:hypothetical protein
VTLFVSAEPESMSMPASNSLPSYDCWSIWLPAWLYFVTVHVTLVRFVCPLSVHDS